MAVDPEGTKAKERANGKAYYGRIIEKRREWREAHSALAKMVDAAFAERRKRATPEQRAATHTTKLLRSRIYHEMNREDRAAYLREWKQARKRSGLELEIQELRAFIERNIKP